MASQLQKQELRDKVAELDADGDGLISWSEFTAGFAVGKPTCPDHQSRDRVALGRKQR